jgi:hypothetical protein
MTRKKSYHLWTTKEIKVLVDYRKNRCTIKEIAIYLDRPFWSVAKKLAEHKIYLPGRSRVINNTYENRV